MEKKAKQRYILGGVIGLLTLFFLIGGIITKVDLNVFSIGIFIVALLFTLNLLIFNKKWIFYVALGILILILILVFIPFDKLLMPKNYVSLDSPNNYTKNYFVYENVNFNAVLHYPTYLVDNNSDSDINKMYTQLFELDNQISPYLYNLKDRDVPTLTIIDEPFLDKINANKLYKDRSHQIQFYILNKSSFEYNLFEKKNINITGDIYQITVDCKKNIITNTDYNNTLSEICSIRRVNGTEVWMDMPEEYTIDYIIVKDINLSNN